MAKKFKKEIDNIKVNKNLNNNIDFINNCSKYFNKKEIE